MDSIWSVDERHVRDYCEHLGRCHEQHSGLRVRAFTFAGCCRIPDQHKTELWNAFDAAYRGELAKNSRELLHEEWQDEDDPTVVSGDGDYFYRFAGDTTGFEKFVALEKEMPIAVPAFPGQSRGASGLFLAGSIALRNQIPLLGADLGYDNLEDNSQGAGDFIERCGLPATILPMAFFRLSLLHDPFLSLKLAMEWLLNPTKPSQDPDVWKPVLGHLPYSDVVEQVIQSLAHRPITTDKVVQAVTAAAIPVEKAAYQFVRQGAVWLLRFAGSEPKWCPHHEGMEYYAKILAAQRGVGISSADIMGAVRTDKKSVEHESNEDDNKRPSAYNAEVRVTEKELRTQIKSIGKEITAELGNKHPAMAKIKELTETQTHLEAALRSSEAENRKAKSENDARTSQIRTYLNRARKAIVGKGQLTLLPILAHHLKEFVHCNNNTWSYEPDRHIEWLIHT